MRWFVLTVVALVGFVVGTGAARAQSMQAPPVAVCLAIDASGSNWAPSDGYAASDAGPAYLRAELVHLVGELLGTDGDARQVLLGWVVFGTDITASAPLTDVRGDAGRQALLHGVDSALRPAGWTSVDRAVAACDRVLAAAPAGSRTRLLLLTDGRAERPEADAAAQIASLQRDVLPGLRARGGALDTVVYGGAAANDGDPAARQMADLAAAGNGKSYPAPREVDLLQVAVPLVQAVLGLPAEPSRVVPLDGQTSVPVDVPAEARIASLTIVAIRSKPDIALAIKDPAGVTIASTNAGSDASGTVSSYSLLKTLINPAPGRYEVQASGVGARIAVSELVRTQPQVVSGGTPAPAPVAPTAPPTAAPTVPAPVETPAPTRTVTPATVIPEPTRVPGPRASGHGIDWLPLLLMVSALLSVAVLLLGLWGSRGAWWPIVTEGLLAVLGGAFSLRRRFGPRPLPGVIVVWQEDTPALTALAALSALLKDTSVCPLAQAAPDPLDGALAGYLLERRGVALFLRTPEGSAEPLPAGVTFEPDTDASWSVTWLPAGADEEAIERGRPVLVG